MAGSMKAMIYESDQLDGTAAKKYKVWIDESNGEALGFTDVNTAADAALPDLPPGWEMRKVSAQTTIGTGAAATILKRSFNVGKRTTDAYAKGANFTAKAYPGGTGTGETWTVKGAQGEVRKFLTGVDTGITDGDAT